MREAVWICYVLFEDHLTNFFTSIIMTKVNESSANKPSLDLS